MIPSCDESCAVRLPCESVRRWRLSRWPACSPQLLIALAMHACAVLQVCRATFAACGPEMVSFLRALGPLAPLRYVLRDRTPQWKQVGGVVCSVLGSVLP